MKQATDFSDLLKSLEADLLSKQNEVEKLREEITGLEHEVEDMKGQQVKASETQRELEMQLQGAQESISSLAKEVEEARGAAETEREQRGDEVERLREEITGLEEEVEDTKRKASETQRELEMQLQGSQESISSLAKEVEEAREEITGLEQEAQATQASANHRVDDLEAHVQLLMRDLEQSVARSSELQAALKHCKSELEEHHKRMEALQVQAEAQHSDAEKEQSDLYRRLGVAQQDVITVSRALELAQVELEEAKNTAQERALDLLSQHHQTQLLLQARDAECLSLQESVREHEV